MQRDREADIAAEVLPEPRDFRHEPARGDSHAPRGKADSFRVCEKAERARRRVVVVERLSHAHVDDVTQALVGVEPRASDEHLGDDLVGPEMALQPSDAARAEDAAHRAAHLGGDALRDANRPGFGGCIVGFRLFVLDRGCGVCVLQRGPNGGRQSAARAGDSRNQDGLHGGAVAERDEQLARAIDGAPLAGDLKGAPELERRELRAQPLGQVGHVLGFEHASDLNPAEDLVGVECAPAEWT